MNLNPVKLARLATMTDEETDRYVEMLAALQKDRELTERFSFESDQEQPHLATVSCNKCSDAWDVKLPLGKGAYNTLKMHFENKHGPPGSFAGEIRKKGWRSRMEHKLDNVASMVSYLPGMKR